MTLVEEYIKDANKKYDTVDAESVEAYLGDFADEMGEKVGKSMNSLVSSMKVDARFKNDEDRRLAIDYINAFRAEVWSLLAESEDWHRWEF